MGVVEPAEKIETDSNSLSKILPEKYLYLRVKYSPTL